MIGQDLQYKLANLLLQRLSPEVHPLTECIFVKLLNSLQTPPSSKVQPSQLSLSAHFSAHSCQSTVVVSSNNVLPWNPVEVAGQLMAPEQRIVRIIDEINILLVIFTSIYNIKVLQSSSNPPVFLHYKLKILNIL